ncbi:MAG: S1 family peptidase [Lysobacter sp.]|nr:S1 family peptidase [Lysobacter sp.]
MRYPIQTLAHRRRHALTAGALSFAVAASLTALSCAAAPPNANAAETLIHAAMARDLGIDAARLPQYLATETRSYSIAAKAPAAVGPAFAGHWIDTGQDGVFRNVVAVAHPTAVARVRSLGADVRVVDYTLAQLEATSVALRRKNAMRIASNGIASWYVDVKSNRVVVTALPGQLAIARATATSALGDAGMRTVRMIEEAGRPETLIGVIGGERYNMSNGGACSVGFPVKRGADIGFATAGHCGTVGTTTSGTDGTAQGIFEGSTFPNVDRAWVKITNASAWPLRDWITDHAGGFVDIQGTQQAPIGAAICRSGFRTGFRCGTVLAFDATANYGSGMVFGLTNTSLCAGHGDSGGSIITPAGQAQGVVSGGVLPPGADDNCGVAMPRTFIQPLGPLLSQFGLSLYTSRMAPPTITNFVCPNNGDSGGGVFSCYALYHSGTPETIAWTGRRQGTSGGNPGWTEFSGPCAARERVGIRVTVSNNFGAATRSASFTCPSGPRR